MKNQDGRGNTRRAQRQTQEPQALQPDERDESADSQEPGEPSARSVGQAAREDIERGVVDTDKGPVMDETYDRVREAADDPLKKLSP
jgi:hypothetical protein